MKYIKKIFKWLYEVLKETIAQTFTLLGFFIAWLTLTGTAKDIVGIAIIVSIVLWLLTIGMRKEPEQKQPGHYGKKKKKKKKSKRKKMGY